MRMLILSDDSTDWVEYLETDFTSTALLSDPDVSASATAVDFEFLEPASDRRIRVKTKLDGMPAINGHIVAMRRNCIRLSIASPKKPSISRLTIQG